MSEDDVFEDVPGIEEDLARAEQQLTVRVERRTYDKPVTIVEGFEDESVDRSDLASELKSNLGAGGTVNDGAIEVQGDHAERVRELLEDRGFSVEA
ncbi:translation initiation factor [Salarchaeum sp. JOR-1]|uniref:translation initiation factor n=1 Tax=Salarchaeum sp. JOR-1 TaxID=2599399 RepID=UPI001198AA20|nr:translation initiation factor [Salarchaeum sp. JOR-1]QDX40730.1 translation initiation factor [Salarchaeum sp. JOR-1]